MITNDNSTDDETEPADGEPTDVQTRDRANPDGTERPLDRPGPSAIPDRFAAFRMGHGENATIVYDRENTAAWIQSDTAMALPVPEPRGESDG